MRGDVLACVLLSGCGRIRFDSVASGGTDASDEVDAVEVPSCPGFATFCDDFESGNLSKWTFVGTSLGGTAMVTNANPHAGSFSLEAKTPAQAQDNAQAAPTFQLAAQTTGVLAMRAWFSLGVPMINFDTVIELETISGATQYITAGGDATALWVSTEADAVNMVGPAHTSTTPTPASGGWNCLELVYTFAAGPTDARLQLFVNEQPVIDVVPDAPTGATFDDAAVGIPRADKAGFDVFIDDVVVAPQRIYCD